MDKSLRQLFIIDPIQQLNPSKDSSIAIMQATQRIGKQNWVCTQADIATQGDQTMVCAHPITMEWIEPSRKDWQISYPWYRIAETRIVPITDFSVVWMRKDPPVDESYLYTTHLLEFGERNGVRVINKPSSLRTWNEKLGALRFSSLMAPTLVASRIETLETFSNNYDDVVLKPLGGRAGQGVVRSSSSSPGFLALLELVTQQQQIPVMAQAFLPTVSAGDKRILLIDGEPLGAINRKPKKGEFRSNLAVGGFPEVTELTSRESGICIELSSVLKSEGLALVGIDVIDGYLSEINVTSPTGIREIERLTNIAFADQAVKKLLVN
uniref:Glutathione synthetase n=1 Tax=Paulinella chromatophora TaxID=39717 RepID=B1X4B1_PAUCH|nr:glutathione synthetase [Paulinella chromatophora]ACB42780.1 glutathione synthetase [Paulinella chromatophora]